MSSSAASLTHKEPKKGYEAFGSFHTEAPDALFAGAAAAFPLPTGAKFPALSSTRLVLKQLESAGNATANRAQFTVDTEAWTYLNHGAFGGATKFASQVASSWREVSDRQPLLFNDRLLFPYIVQAIQALAKFANVHDAQELVLLPNATSGLHAVLQSVVHSAVNDDGNARDPIVFCFSTRYGAVRKMLQAIGDEMGSRSQQLRIHEEPLSLEESYDDEKVQHKLRLTLEKLQQEENGRCVLVVVDHITSNTGVKFPVEEIVALCHAYNVPVLVDGAHGLLNLPLDITAINADYYVGNCHKWFCSPKGAGFLHLNRTNGLDVTRRIPISPRIVSHGFFDGFQSAFMWIGLQDYSSWLSLPKCIEFWEYHGVEECREYMHSLAQDATELLYTAWEMPEELAQAKIFPVEKRHAMRLVKLPPGQVFGIDTSQSTKNTSMDAKFIQDTLHHEHHIEVPIKCVDETLYVRISAHLYNTLDDYKQLAKAIMQK
uniref:Aminotransferase class V domain-containing protein n=1 Tax=Globisporangium ultimum (strain ATCC 200006 / CBS 805.95 / DAOM BR144) TaxID=431595 RepID=K3X1L7_GLOUD